MNTPQIIYIVLTCLSLYVAADKHGEPKGNYDFWGSLFGVAIMIGILIWGGFFK